MYKEIQQQFNEVILESQGFMPKTDKLFELWRENKQWFLNKTKGRLIVESKEEISFDMDDETKLHYIDEFIDFVGTFGLFELCDYIHAQREGFFKNEVVVSYNYGNTHIPAGSKLLKSFKIFITNKDLLYEIQNRASMIIQEIKVKGILCLSVHPLDYLSVSENNHGWRSCHALDGEYRAGNLSYMADSATIVCYLKSKKDTVLPNFPKEIKWNSKKWRTLLFFSNDKREMFFGRQYPMFCKDSFPIVMKMLESVGLTDRGWIDPFDTNVSVLTNENQTRDFILHDIYYPIQGKLYGINSIVKDKSGLHFNDLLRSSCYTPWVTYHWEDLSYCCGPVKFEIGYDIPCLACGSDSISDNAEEGTMLCDDCYDGCDNSRIQWCDYCGCSHDQDDMFFVDGTIVCPDCAVDKIKWCSWCDKPMLVENAIFDSETGKCYCCEGHLDMSKQGERDNG